MFPLAVAQSPGDSVTSIDRNLIVDCRLPPQVRKLGMNVVTQMPGRVVKVSKIECETRGGLYVLFDAADPETALKIWLDSAKQGDANAQNRVGQIYELGIAGPPNYAEAAKWYRLAVDNGSRAAAINLATLYYQGLGVAKDHKAAADLYRQAEGVGAGAGKPMPPTELEKSRQRVQELEKELAALKAAKSSPPNKAPAERGSPSPGPSSEALASTLEVGADAGSQPAITILDPNIPPTRGVSEVKVRGEIRTKEIIGRVKAKLGLATLTINERKVDADKFGFFDAPVRVAPEGTPVVVAAVDTTGQRGELSFVVRPGSVADATVVPPHLPIAEGDAGNFYALVIGNRRYTAKGIPELKNAESDARSMAALLEQKYGFRKPKVLIDGTHDQILNALNDFALTLGPQDNLLVYYAGHGQFDLGKRGYWIPVDAEIERNTRWISNIQITDLIQKMNARKVIVVSDSCYAGAMTAAENGAISTIHPGNTDDQQVLAESQLLRTRSRTVLGSGGLAPVLEGGGGEHSVFTRALLDTLSSNSDPLEGYRLFVALEARVLRIAQKYDFDQAPVYAAIQHAGHEGGDFVFMPVH